MIRKREDINSEAAKAAAEKSELAAVLYCRDKYRWLARNMEGYTRECITRSTCALCQRHPSDTCRGCPLHDPGYDRNSCSRLWSRVNYFEYPPGNADFRAACGHLADELDRIANRLRTESRPKSNTIEGASRMKKSRIRTWTEKMNKILRRRYPRDDTWSIAVDLGMSYYAVKKQASRLGVKKLRGKAKVKK